MTRHGRGCWPNGPRWPDLLAGTESSAREDRETEDEDAQVYDSDAAPDLVAEGMDDAIADSLRERLAALDRALKRLDDGTYGRSVRSGAADPRRSSRGRPGGRAHHRGGPGGHLTTAQASAVGAGRRWCARASRTLPW